jgi:hypothetical protein
MQAEFSVSGYVLSIWIDCRLIPLIHNLRFQEDEHGFVAGGIVHASAEQDGATRGQVAWHASATIMPPRRGGVRQEAGYRLSVPSVAQLKKHKVKNPPAACSDRYFPCALRHIESFFMLD